jgi:hypothetical protein
MSRKKQVGGPARTCLTWLWQAHEPRTLLSRHRALRFSLSESGTVFQKKSVLALSFGAVAAGVASCSQGSASSSPT